MVMPEVTPPPAIIPPPPPPPPAQSSLERAKALVEEGTRILLRAPPQAIGVLLRAIRLAPKYAEAHKQLGIAYNAIGNDAAAARHFRRYLGLRPSASDADEVKRLLDEADRATKGTP